MIDLLVRLMFVAALSEFGMTLVQVEQCHSRECLQNLEARSRDVLKIDWKPLSVFPEDSKRFKKIRQPHFLK